MAKRPWLDRVLDSVADRGRELMNRSHGRHRAHDLEGLCRTLLSGQGEASGVAMAREVIQRYEGMNPEERAQFFDTLLHRFGPDRDAIRAVTDAYLANGDSDTLLALTAAVEAPRQELFRRMNMAPGGTRALVLMRSHLLDAVRKAPQLRPVEADLKHLLMSWFNPGFLRLERIDWQSPAEVLEKLIRYEAVHAIRGWEDLRRRLARDRRCFAFFHPALPSEPLIFLEVALAEGMPAEISPLIDPAAQVIDPDDADAAVFYSISNTQRGLRGISFGNFLIKQVMADLSAELPNLTTFVTLSPMPRFARILTAAAEGRHAEYTRERLEALLKEDADELCGAASVPDSDPVHAMLTLLEREPGHRTLAKPLERLALAYLTLLPRERSSFDPVAMFHLSNGARLERVNPFADPSEEGRRTAFGVMVNYRYDPHEVEENHERFMGTGQVRMSRSLTRLHHKIAALWEAT
jgi:malonyl-CoA decarboxylase